MRMQRLPNWGAALKNSPKGLRLHRATTVARTARRPPSCHRSQLELRHLGDRLSTLALGTTLLF